MKESRIKGEKKSVAPGRGGKKGAERVMGTGESEEDGGEKVGGKARQEGGREEVSWISGAVLQRDTSAF